MVSRWISESKSPALPRLLTGSLRENCFKVVGFCLWRAIKRRPRFFIGARPGSPCGSFVWKVICLILVAHDSTARCRSVGVILGDSLMVTTSSKGNHTGKFRQKDSREIILVLLNCLHARLFEAKNLRTT